MAIEDVLELWSRFPIEQVPRPVVLLEEPVRVGARGFTSGEAKLAWAAGAITATVALPSAVLELLIRPGAGPRVNPVVITAVTRTQARFQCDRGPRHLPALELTCTGLADECVVLDPDVPLWWPPANRRGEGVRSAGQAELAEDDQTLRIPAFGGPLTEFLHAEFTEHRSYVVVRALIRERGLPAGTAVPAVGVHRMITGRLSEPLGQRVLVDEHGEPMAVIHRGGRERRRA